MAGGRCWSLSSEKMIQQAKEELQILEAHYPNRFDYLKLELNSFIFQYHYCHSPISTPSTPATTQGSSTNKKRKINVEEDDGDGRLMVKQRKDRVDLVLERAELCLRKIRQVKSTFFS
ncbi:uncharacterized protein LOC110810194 [Carica papaya]|uniref:uncharacterized protein LOC110810194 n=1 Tax=Carica papaya TaxID=3649 RepID=UPI000B8CAFAE|nr:uncharacterized protein LOC110810194 [Carica papaya]